MVSLAKVRKAKTRHHGPMKRKAQLLRYLVFLSHEKLQRQQGTLASGAPSAVQDRILGTQIGSECGWAHMHSPGKRTVLKGQWDRYSVNVGRKNYVNTDSVDRSNAWGKV